MNKILIIGLFGFIGCVCAQPSPFPKDIKYYLKNKKKFLISPSVNCYSIDTCYINYKYLKIRVIKALSEDEEKKIILNNNFFAIKKLVNPREELTISPLEFPAYEYSTYYLVTV